MGQRGTKNLAASYPDPFTAPSTACPLAPTATEGPCTEAADQVRKDISEGYPGLPVRLALKVVDASCAPVAGATVKVWHTQLTGSYSGDTPNPGMCLKDQADSAKHYFRGVQTTDASGRVAFDTCFPGWYRGRAIHIHYTVTHGGRSYTSQLIFDQALVSDIFSSHPDYQPFGLPDTPNASDNVVGNANLASYVASAARQSDGALLAWKQLVVSVG
jgi:protocatechuate 3,4-dioxygenase beta subunit